MHMLRRSISCMLAGVLAVSPALALLYGLLGYWTPGHAFEALSVLFAWVPGHAFAALSMLFASVAGVIWLYDEVAEILRGPADRGDDVPPSPVTASRRAAREREQ